MSYLCLVAVRVAEIRSLGRPGIPLSDSGRSVAQNRHIRDESWPLRWHGLPPYALWLRPSPCSFGLLGERRSLVLANS
jgi:hypothetical protein